MSSLLPKVTKLLDPPLEATNEPVTEFASPQDYCRETLCYPTIDKIVAETKARFDENEQEMLCALKTGYGTRNR